MDDESRKIELGARIAVLRKSKRMSQEDLAGSAGVSVEAISNIERGVNFPSLGTLFKIADALGSAAPDLLGDRPSARLSARRAQLAARIQLALAGLTDAQFEVAVKQIEALAGR